jgi:hypothetical protein
MHPGRREFKVGKNWADIRELSPAKAGLRWALNQLKEGSGEERRGEVKLAENLGEIAKPAVRQSKAAA